jgi:transposase
LFDGTQLGANLKNELIREYKRMLHVDEQIKEIWKKRRQMAKAARQEQEKREARAIRPEAMSNLDKAIALMMLCGIGERSSWKLSNEIFWRTFSNRREVGSSAGLTGTPYNSGGEVKEQGISKAGNKRIRTLMVELAWFWMRYQPDSSITKWFAQRFAANGKRMRRIGIVAVARKLLIALWRYVEFGVIPEGARFKQA